MSDQTGYYWVKVVYLQGLAQHQTGNFGPLLHDEAQACVVHLSLREDVHSAIIEPAPKYKPRSKGQPLAKFLEQLRERNAQKRRADSGDGATADRTEQGSSAESLHSADASAPARAVEAPQLSSETVDVDAAGHDY